MGMVYPQSDDAKLHTGTGSTTRASKELTTRRPQVLGRICLAAILLTLPACANAATPGSGSDEDPAPPGYEVHRARWEDQGIDTYSFSLYLGAFEGPMGPFCGQAQVRIGVEAGVPARVREPYGCAVDPGDPALAWVPFTIDELFGLIRENGIRADYDDELGYPRAVVSEGRLSFEGDVIFPDRGAGFELFVNELQPGSADVGSTAEVLATLEQQRQLWESHAIDTYQLHVERVCFCPPGSYRVEVAAGTVASVTDEEGAVSLESDELRGFPLRVEDLFAEIDKSAFADNIQVAYDAELGYPTTIAVDHMANAIDDEVTFLVTRFRAG
jgi:hypothetical protein